VEKFKLKLLNNKQRGYYFFINQTDLDKNSINEIAQSLQEDLIQIAKVKRKLIYLAKTSLEKKWHIFYNILIDFIK